MQCMSVDLPEPDGPMTAVKRPRSNSTVIAVEGADDGVALPVGLDQVDGAGGRRRPAPRSVPARSTSSGSVLSCRAVAGRG